MCDRRGMRVPPGLEAAATEDAPNPTARTRGSLVAAAVSAAGPLNAGAAPAGRHGTARGGGLVGHPGRPSLAGCEHVGNPQIHMAFTPRGPPARQAALHRVHADLPPFDPCAMNSTEPD